MPLLRSTYRTHSFRRNQMIGRLRAGRDRARASGPGSGRSTVSEDTTLLRKSGSAGERGSHRITSGSRRRRNGSDGDSQRLHQYVRRHSVEIVETRLVRPSYESAGSGRGSPT